MDPLQGLQLQENSQGNNITHNTKADTLVRDLAPVMVTRNSRNTDSEQNSLSAKRLVISSAIQEAIPIEPRVSHSLKFKFFATGIYSFVQPELPLVLLFTCRITVLTSRMRTTGSFDLISNILNVTGRRRRFL
jgi:hypothetical protein